METDSNTVVHPDRADSKAERYRPPAILEVLERTCFALPDVDSFVAIPWSRQRYPTSGPGIDDLAQRVIRREQRSEPAKSTGLLTAPR